MSLTIADLDASLARDDHLGWGYATARSLDVVRRELLDRAIVDVANELGLDADGLFLWANSKNGRWLVDAVYGRDALPDADTVRDFLNEDEMATLWKEED